MINVKFRLPERDYDDFKGLLQACMDCDIPLFDQYIAEKILKILEDDED